MRESSESRLTNNIASSSRNFLALKCYCKIVEVVLTTSSAYIFWEGKLTNNSIVANNSIVYSIFRNRRLLFEKQMENVRVGLYTFRHSPFCIHIIIICLLFHDCLILYLRPRLKIFKA